MIQLEKILQEHLATGLKAVFNLDVTPESLGFQPTRKEFEGSLTFTTFPFTKPLKATPEDLGQKLGTWLQEKSGIVSRFNVVKGFLNLTISEEAWRTLFINEIQKSSFGTLPKKNKKVMVEYSSPNTNKPLHLGHLRNNFLGFSVSEILKASGYDVVMVNLVNDRGIHICKSMLAYMKKGNGETPASSGMKGDHLVGKYYVEFDKMLKAEMKPISEQVASGDLSLFTDAQKNTITTAKTKIAAIEAVLETEKKTVNEFIKGKSGAVYEKINDAIEAKITWKSLQKQLEDLLSDETDDKLLKTIQKTIKGAVSCEEKIEDQKETITELIKTKTSVLIEAQELLLKWEQGDKATVDLWKTMNGWVYEGFNATYKMIGVDFDKYYYESNTYLLGKEIVEEGLAKGSFYKKEDNSVWIDLTSDGLDHKLLLRGDGTSVYITQDLGTAELKYKEFGCDNSIYVVGNEQDYHFQVLQLILKKLDKPYAPGIFHLSYGMVDLPSGRMKSREGTVVDADDLVSEMIKATEEQTRKLGKIEDFESEEAKILYRQLALGALKYFLLRVDPKRRMLFNPEESIDLHGNTGPYIQYTHARISTLMRKATADKLSFDTAAFSVYKNLHASELDVIAHLSIFPSVIEDAAKNFSPSLISQYVYELAKIYNRMYDQVSVFKDTTEGAMAFRLALSEATRPVIQKGLNLLGIEAPERM